MIVLVNALVLFPALAEPPPAEDAADISLEVAVPALGIEAREIHCASPTPVVAGIPSAGALTAQIRLRRDVVRLVTVSDTDPGLEWMAPCFERELTAVDWPWSGGRHRIALEVSPAAADEPVDE